MQSSRKDTTWCILDGTSIINFKIESYFSEHLWLQFQNNYISKYFGVNMKHKY